MDDGDAQVFGVRVPADGAVRNLFSYEYRHKL